MCICLKGQTLEDMNRLDRFLTLSLFRPLSILLQHKGLRIPILMYHSVSSDREEGIHPYYKVATAASVFDEHMKFLAGQAYQVINLDMAVDILNRHGDHEKQNVGAKYAVITFDDGYQDYYTQAFPILERYKFTATVFLPTDYIGRSFKEKLCLTWNQVRELRRYGHYIGSHTATHPQLQKLPRMVVREELRSSKKQIEDALGEPISAFSYPFRFPEQDRKFVDLLKDEMKSAGYKVGVTTIIGRADIGIEPLFLKRLPANSSDDPALLEAKLKGSYDLMHVAQYAAKSAKKIFRLD